MGRRSSKCWLRGEHAMDHMVYGWEVLQHVSSPIVNDQLKIHGNLRCLNWVWSGWFEFGVVRVKLLDDDQSHLERSHWCHTFLGFGTVWDTQALITIKLH